MTRTTLCQVTVSNQRPEMLLKRVAIAAGDLGGIAERDGSVCPCEFEDLHGQLRQLGQQNSLALDLAFEAPHLLCQRAQEKYKPGLPVQRRCADGSLRLP